MNEKTKPTFNYNREDTKEFILRVNKKGGIIIGDVECNQKSGKWEYDKMLKVHFQCPNLDGHILNEELSKLKNNQRVKLILL